MSKKTVRDIAKGKNTHACGLQRSMVENHKITDDSRIMGALPTIQYHHDAGAKLILMSHRGQEKKKIFARACCCKAFRAAK